MPPQDTNDQKHHAAHSGFYLTLVSIMQGLALGYLLQVVAAELTTSGTISVLTAVQFIACLTLLIIVWHEYAMGTVFFRWRLDMADSAIPFMFGICEYIMIAALSIPTSGHILSASRFALWLWSLPAFCVVSCLAYWNQYSKAVIDDDSREMVVVCRRNWFQAFWTTIGYAAFACIYQFYHFANLGQIILASIVATSLVGHALRINKAYASRSSA